MSKDSENEWLRKRMDAVILLLLERSPEPAKSTAQKIERLLGLGLSQPDVAQILGKKLNYITAVVSRKGAIAARDDA